MYQEERPKIALSHSYADKVQEIVAGVLLGLHWLLVGLSFADLPDVIPHHFNHRGEADGWGHKSMLFALPVISTFVYSLMTFLNRSPEIFNYPFRITPENAESAYYRATRLLRLIKLNIMVLTIYLSWSIVEGVHTGRMALKPWYGWVVVAAVVVPVFVFLFQGSGKKGG